MIFKPATIADTFVAFVFFNMRFYHPLSITDCDIKANVEDRGYFENFAGTEKDPHSMMQIMKLSIFVTHVILLFQTQHPFSKIATTNSLPSV